MTKPKEPDMPPTALDSQTLTKSSLYPAVVDTRAETQRIMREHKARRAYQSVKIGVGSAFYFGPREAQDAADELADLVSTAPTVHHWSRTDVAIAAFLSGMAFTGVLAFVVCRYFVTLH